MPIDSPYTTSGIGPPPTFPPGSPRGDLGEVEGRMRKLLGLDGLVPLGWNTQIVPVVLVGDGMLPGMSSRLRRMSSPSFTGGIGTGFWFKALQDVIIERVTMILGVAAGITARYLGPTDADPVAFPNTLFQMLDRASQPEPGPIASSAVVAGAGGTLIYGPSTNLSTNVIHTIFEYPFMLAQGAKFHVQGAQAGTIQVYARTTY